MPYSGDDDADTNAVNEPEVEQEGEEDDTPMASTSSGRPSFGFGCLVCHRLPHFAVNTWLLVKSKIVGMRADKRMYF